MTSTPSRSISLYLVMRMAVSWCEWWLSSCVFWLCCQMQKFFKVVCALKEIAGPSYKWHIKKSDGGVTTARSLESVFYIQKILCCVVKLLSASLHLLLTDNVCFPSSACHSSGTKMFLVHNSTSTKGELITPHLSKVQLFYTVWADQQNQFLLPLNC